jgi:protein tyrosine/serine phosphatase
MDGHTVRFGRLFRSDELHRLTPEDVEVLAGFGIISLLDLRSIQEATDRRAAQLFDRGVAHRHFPLSEDADPARYASLATIAMDELYFGFLDQRRDSLRSLFATLADEATYPAVVHCAAGKDRTGLVVALVLRTLGVSDEEIAADYALTDEAMERVVAALRAAGRAEMLAQVPPHLLRALPETMTLFLNRLDTHFGSTAAFFADAGIPESDLNRIRENLLTPTN